MNCCLSKSAELATSRWCSLLRSAFDVDFVSRTLLPLLLLLLFRLFPSSLSDNISNLIVIVVIIVIVNSRCVQRRQKRSCGDQLIYRRLSKTKSIGSGSDPESQQPYTP